MLEFTTTPDPVFRAIVEAALMHIREQLYPYVETYTPPATDLKEQDEFYADLYDELVPFFTRAEALQLVDRLQAALLDEKTVYELTDYHRLVLYYALAMFCDLHNDKALGDDGEVGPYIIDRIEVSHILEVYFPDTDFLMGPDLLHSEEFQPGEMGFTRAAWRIAAGLRPEPEDLQLTAIPPGRSTMELLEPPPNGWPTSGYIGPYPLKEPESGA
jgi:hypothetical protein